MNETYRYGATCGFWGWPACWSHDYTCHICTAMSRCERTCGSWGHRESETTWNTESICAASPADITQFTSSCSLEHKRWLQLFLYVSNEFTLTNQSTKFHQEQSMLALVTNADESRGSKALILVCLCVCLYDRTKTAETTITKLATGIVHHKSWLPI